MPPSQQQDFQARLARLGGATQPAQQVASDENIVSAAPVSTRRFETFDDSFQGRIAYPLSILWAFCFGILSVFLARLVIAHMGGAPDGAEAISLYLIDLAVAAGTLFALNIAMRNVDKIKSTAGLIGLFVAVTTMHNLFWMFPEFFSLLYGEEWVDALLKRSEPSSLYFRGQYILVD